MAGYRKNEVAETAYTKIPGEKVVNVIISSALYRPSYSVDFYNRISPSVVKKEVIKPRIVAGSAWARPLKF